MIDGIEEVKEKRGSFCLAAVVGFLAYAIIFSLSGCVKNTNIESSEFEQFCLEGVSYWMHNRSMGYTGHGYMSPVFNQDSTVRLCSIN